MNDSSAHSKSCPKCGAELPAEATEGLCPRCLMAEAMQPTSSKTSSGRWEPLPPAELQALMPGYTIEKLLGKGGMGAVYKGVQENLDRPVAIKIISNVLDEVDASYGERFKNEARAMAKLNHPGIVAVHDYGETANGILYIVMEYIEGTDVAHMIAQQGRLHTEHAMAISAHVCDALAYAHERGIIHRDIKPANIMVSHDGVVKVADFGLAKMTQSGESGLTQSGVAMGTLHYMAPEALMLGASVDHRADIYAVGVMLYQMLTGKVPHGMFELPSMQVPGLDPRYDAIIAQAMREDRDIRYQSARELRGSLDHILTQPVVQVDPQATRAAAALPPQAGRPTTQVHRSAGRPNRPPQSQVVYVQKKSSPLPWVAVVVALLGVLAWLVINRSQPLPADLKQAAVTAADAANAPTSPPAAASGSSTANAATATKDHPSGTSGAANGTQPVKADVKVPSIPTDWMDVMPLIEPVKNAQLSHRLSWTRTPAGFECKRVDDQRIYSGCLQIPVPVPSSYAVEAEVTAGSAYSVGITVPVGDGARTTCWIVADRKVAGIGKIDGKDPWDKTLALGCASPFKLESGRRYKLDAEVRRVPEGVDIQFGVDGKLVGAYRGPTNRLSVCSCWNKGGDPALVDFGANDTATFHAVKVKALVAPAETSTAPASRTLVPTIPELAALQQQLIKLQAERVTAAFEADVAKLNSGYLGGLDREMAKDRAAGRLDGVLALEAEKKLMTAKQPVPSADDASTHAAVKNLRAIYREAYAKLEDARMVNSKALTGPLALRLKTLEADLTRQNRIADAKAVREYREALPVEESTAAYSVVNPFINSLGMKFVPVPGTEVLFCTTLTRLVDYNIFAAETPGVQPVGDPGGEQRDRALFPANALSWANAKAFCEWLSRKEGRTYRLPMDREWSMAVGIGSQEFKSATPEELNGKLAGVYPWGSQWPPPNGFANYMDETYLAFCKANKYTPAPIIKGYTDGEIAIAPVEAFKPNRFGLHDMGGNLWQWCEDWYDAAKSQRLLRGGCWDDSSKERLLSSARWPNAPDFQETQTNRTSFRCVLVTFLVAGGKNVTPAQSSAPPVATAPQPAAGITAANAVFTNTLGMKFVPVPGTKIKMCIHETRKVDFANFAFAVAATNASWKNVRIQDGLTVSASDDHPVVNVSWEEAAAFCAWLSQKEGKTYRLPTDREWSIAVGIGTKETQLGTPESRSEKLKDIYPWGTQWPPPASAGNYADATLAGRSPTQKTIPGFTDGHATTAPVMSFPPNALGIHDLGGNVWEFCSDVFSTAGKVHVLRGGSWGDSEQHWLLSSSRDPFEQSGRYNIVGFRCVLESPAP